MCEHESAVVPGHLRLPVVTWPHGGRKGRQKPSQTQMRRCGVKEPAQEMFQADSPFPPVQRDGGGEKELRSPEGFLSFVGTQRRLLSSLVLEQEC